MTSIEHRFEFVEFETAAKAIWGKRVSGHWGCPPCGWYLPPELEWTPWQMDDAFRRHVQRSLKEGR